MSANLLFKVAAFVFVNEIVHLETFMTTQRQEQSTVVINMQRREEMGIIYLLSPSRTF